jgi:hypothetical protein
MDRGTSTPQTPPSGNQPTDPSPDSRPRPAPQAATGEILNVGSAFLRTVRHFFPDFNVWLEELPDGRDQEAIIYERRFLAWWGILLYLLQLKSRRQLDFNLDNDVTFVLANINRLAGTKQTTRPVHDTLDYFLGKSRASALAKLRTKMLRHLIRMKILDEARLLGRLVVAVDATGWLFFRERHCDHCLVREHQSGTQYAHQVLEAKVLGPEGLTFSIGTAFIENADAPKTPASAENFKQDCELSAFSRLAVQLKSEFPQQRICLSGDGLYACGRTFQIAQDNRWSYVLTFKEGHMPAVWREFQSLLRLTPENVLERTLTRGCATVQQRYRWVQDLSYADDQKRTWTFNAIICEETVDGQTTTFAWVTNLPVDAATVADIANQGGRARWQIENQGFNRQKNSGLNLEHAYSKDPEKSKAYYYLLQIAHILIILLENGKYLRQLAKAAGKTVVEWFGSLGNIARRLLESIRYRLWPAEETPPPSAGVLPIPDSS